MLQVTSRSRSLFYLLAAAIVVVAFLSLSRWLQQGGGTRLDSSAQLHLLSGAAYLCLLAGVGGLRVALRMRRANKGAARPYTSWQVLLLAFALPLAVTWLPDWVALGPSWEARVVWSSTPLWLPVIQGAALTILLAAGGDFAQPQAGGEGGLNGALAGLLAGMGLWLGGAFLYGLLLALVPSLRPPISGYPPVLGGILAASALVLLPVSEELFFRGRLMAEWQARFGRVGGAALVAAAAAALLMRPLIFLPVFAAGVGLAWLAGARGLRAAVFAHLMINALALLVLPALVF